MRASPTMSRPAYERLTRRQKMAWHARMASETAFGLHAWAHIDALERLEWTPQAIAEEASLKGWTGRISVSGYGDAHT